MIHRLWLEKWTFLFHKIIEFVHFVQRFNMGTVHEPCQIVLSGFPSFTCLLTLSDGTWLILGFGFGQRDGFLYLNWSKYAYFAKKYRIFWNINISYILKLRFRKFKIVKFIPYRVISAKNGKNCFFKNFNQSAFGMTLGFYDQYLWILSYFWFLMPFCSWNFSYLPFFSFYKYESMRE